MWPFSRKGKSGNPALSLVQALEALAAIGIRRRPGVSDEDLLSSLGGTMDSPVDWVNLLCVLGGEAVVGAAEDAEVLGIVLSPEGAGADVVELEERGGAAPVAVWRDVRAPGAVPLEDVSANGVRNA